MTVPVIQCPSPATAKAISFRGSTILVGTARITKDWYGPNPSKNRRSLESKADERSCWIVIDLSAAARVWATKRLIRIMFLELNEGPARDLTCGGWKSLCQKHRVSCRMALIRQYTSSWTASAEVASGSCAAFTRPRPRSRCITSRSRWLGKVCMWSSQRRKPAARYVAQLLGTIDYRSALGLG